MPSIPVQAKTKTLITLVSFLFLVACESGTSRRARELISEGDYRAAEELLELEVADDPKNTSAYMLLGEIRLLRGEGRDAMRAFETASNLDESKKEEIPRRFLAAAETLLATGNTSLALRCVGTLASLEATSDKTREKAWNLISANIADEDRGFERILQLTRVARDVYPERRDELASQVSSRVVEVLENRQDANKQGEDTKHDDDEELASLLRFMGGGESEQRSEAARLSLQIARDRAGRSQTLNVVAFAAEAVRIDESLKTEAAEFLTELVVSESRAAPEAANVVLSWGPPFVTEEFAWKLVQTEDPNVARAKQYLDWYPNGVHAEEAEAVIEQYVEYTIDLIRCNQSRREKAVQEALKVLPYEPRLLAAMEEAKRLETSQPDGIIGLDTSMKLLFFTRSWRTKASLAELPFGYWTKAEKTCSNTRFATSGSWRLPTIAELKALLAAHRQFYGYPRGGEDAIWSSSRSGTEAWVAGPESKPYLKPATEYGGSQAMARIVCVTRAAPSEFPVLSGACKGK